MKIRRLVSLSFLLAMAITLNLAESLLIPSVGLPGVKFGLTNIIILIILYKFDFKDALFVSLIRVIVTSMIFGNIFQMGFVMSIVGALLSLLVMWLLKTVAKKLSIITVSVVGSIVHVISQIAVGALYLQTVYIFYYLPILALTSIATGVIVGIISKSIIKTKIFSNLHEIDSPKMTGTKKETAV